MTGSVDLGTPLSLIDTTEREPGLTIQDYFNRLNPPPLPIVCIRDGKPVLRAFWHEVVEPNQQVAFCILPGSEGFTKILRSIAFIALAVFAPYVAGPMGLAAAIGLGTPLGISLVSAGLLLGGSLLINALLPIDVPNTNNSPAYSSPTYSLSASGNSARLMAPIPRVYGTHILVPDFAAQPFQYFKGDDQYLLQLMSLGVGYVDVHKIFIANSELWDETDGFSSTYNDVEFEIIEPGGSLTLFPAAIVSSTEVGGQDLVRYMGERNVVYLGNRMTWNGNIDADFKLDNILIGDVIVITGDDLPDNNGTYTVTDTSGDGQWIEIVGTFPVDGTDNEAYIETTSYIGPYATTDSSKVTNKIQCDFIMGRGLFYSNDKGKLTNHTITIQVTARSIDAIGDPTSDWSLLGEHTYTDNTANVLRRTEEYDVAEGRYEVRVQRMSHKQPDTRYANDIVWGGMRAFIPDDSTFPDVTLLAIKMRASNQLTQQASRQFRVLLTGKIPIWNGTTWSAPTATRSLAWAVADILRNSVYGGNVPDARIDLDTLLTLDALWTSRGDYFDGVFDTKNGLFDAVSDALKGGRTQPIVLAGKISFVRDQSVSIVRSMLTPRNIIENTFEVTYILQDDDSPDAIIVEFIDNRTWERNEVLCQLEGAEDAENPARITLFGVTDREHAWREGMYQVAVNNYRRIFATLGVELEGRMMIRGDAVTVSHDLTSWGQPAEVYSWDEDTRTLYITEAVTSGDVIGISDRTGALWGPVTISSISPDGYTIILDETDLAAVESDQGEIPIFIGLEEEPTRVSVGTAESFMKRMKIISTKPNGLETVTISLTIDDPRVYTADTGEVPEEVIGGGPGTIPGAPEVTGVVFNLDPSSLTDPVKLNGSWNPSPGAESYIVQASTNAITFKTTYEGVANNCQFEIPAGSITLRVAAIGTLGQGPWAYPTPNPVSYGTATVTPGEVDDLDVDINVAAGTLAINYTAGTRAVSYLIKVYTDDVTPTVYDQEVMSRVSYSTSCLFTSTDVLDAGGLWDSFRVGVTSVNALGSSAEVSYTETDIEMPGPTSIQLLTTYHGSELNFKWTSVAVADQYEIEIIVASVVIQTYNTSSTSLYISPTELGVIGGPWRDLTISVKAMAGTLYSDPTVLVVSDTAPAALSGLAVEQSDVNEMTIVWDAIVDSDLKDYVVHMDTTSGFTPTEGNKIYSGTDLSRIQPGLTNGVTYYFKAYARDHYAPETGFNVASEVSATCNPDLIVNGTFAVDANWNKGAGITISSGEMHSSTASSVNQEIVAGLVVGDTYKAVYTVTAISGGSSIRPRYTGGTIVSFTTRSAVGTYAEKKTTVATNTHFGFVTNAPGTLSIDNVKLFKIS